MIEWSKYKSSPPTMKPNKMLIPVNNFGFNETDISEFNEIYQYCYEKHQTGEFREFIKTKSSGISIKKGNICGPMCLVTVKSTVIEILIRNLDARYYRFIIGHNKDKDSKSGRKAFQQYKQELLKDGVDLESLALQGEKEDNELVKKTIPSPKIELFVKPDLTYYNAHHLDINSAFNAGMMKAFPALETSVRRMYNMRKVNPDFKDILNMTQGFMQSEMVSYKFAHISKAGYVFTNEYIDSLTDKLKNSGRRVLSYNTDGIWYQGEIYHDENEGTDIGQWKNDHVNCKIRFKSKGAYEFEDSEGVYKPVVRGESSYERIKPRSEWQWGDIYMGEVVRYRFIEGIGVYREDDES